MLKHEIQTRSKLSRIPTCIQKEPSSSAGYLDTCWIHPKERTQDSEHGESWKSWYMFSLSHSRVFALNPATSVPTHHSQS